MAVARALSASKGPHLVITYALNPDAPVFYSATSAHMFWLNPLAPAFSPMVDLKSRVASTLGPSSPSPAVSPAPLTSMTEIATVNPNVVGE